jgi:hypothetical protein
MNQYMIDIELPRPMSAEFLSLIPSQRAMVSTLLADGKISSYMLSMDRAKLWVVVNATSASEARGIIASFPIIAFVRFETHELAFHEQVKTMLQQISLN